ncbi:hypothetical protein [Persicitalea sp.]|uniref:hypothetical protein n=1 Tax=Persicitalea sp. TaxID=3100273 RepID=UPI00359428AC
MTELTKDELEAAAANLSRLRVWVKDLYPLCLEYEEAVFHALGSTKENGDWRNFLANIMIDVAIGLTSAAALASLNPEFIPALACLSAALHDWGIGKDKPNSLNGEFADFEFGHGQMQLEIEQKLSSLVDPTSGYSNLKAAWKDSIAFNGTTYTIGDLATSHFPGLGDAYNQLQSAALTSFKKSLWNLVIMKTCSYYKNWEDVVTTPKHMGAIEEYAQKAFYPANKGLYLRARYIDTSSTTNSYALAFWNLGIGGYAFPDEASKILFKDDTPGHIINPDGLFNRSYVFQQFSTRKPVFHGGHELGHGTLNDEFDEFDFTGGMFPKLIEM